jgi:glycolate oxidase iron-sulfur subunit
MQAPLSNRMAVPQKSASSYFTGAMIPDENILVQCMHCGLCLPVCPTYAITGLEKSSPRGRIRLIKAVAEGELPMTHDFIHEMNFCLDCQACETACPAGVKYGALVEAARTQILEQGRESFVSSLGTRVLLEWLFERPWRLRAVGRLLRFFERTVKDVLQQSRVLTSYCKRLNSLLELTPKISDSFSSLSLPHRSTPLSTPKYRVAFLTGCIMDVAYADVNKDTIDLLIYHDCEVIIPREQNCCGSLQAHYGSMTAAQQMARNNIIAFEQENFDYIVLNSAGCGAFMKDYGRVLADDPEFAERADALSRKVVDITEFLCRIGMKAASHIHPNASFIGKRVTYHDACHLAHTQHITKEPRALLAMFSEFEYVELPESTWCCGSAGIYNIVNYESSMQILERKMANISSVHPDIIVTANPGCMVQIHYGLQKRGMPVEVMHTATFLKQCLMGRP